MHPCEAEPAWKGCCAACWPGTAVLGLGLHRSSYTEEEPALWALPLVALAGSGGCGCGLNVLKLIKSKQSESKTQAEPLA